MSESDLRITADDYLLYRRCPRSLHRRLTGGLSTVRSEADALYPVVPDRRRLHDLVCSHLSRGSQASNSSVAFDASRRAGPFDAVADVRHPQKPSGMAAVLVREATSIKESYLLEAAFVDFCFSACGERPARIFVYHVNKSYERIGPLDLDALFVRCDVTRRVRRVSEETASELERLRVELEADPTLGIYRGVPCSRPQSCPVCSEDLPEADPAHVSTLHRGGALVSELLEEGITLITDVPTERLVHRRQEIQQKTLREGRPHVDSERLGLFLNRLAWPIGYLDFEATSTAIPPFDRIRPWEHVPYLYSLHREHADGRLVHTSYLAEPGVDGRAVMADRLVREAGEEGSIVVYSAGFERGILRRLAAAVPERADELESIANRLVDLLEPFSEFVFYHQEQKGKVSLKTVLPVLTSRDYSGEEIRDGYTANLAYRYLAGGGDGCPESGAELLENLASYCALDTMAMVHIVHELRELVYGGP